MELGAGFWISSGSFIAVFLVAVVVEQWMLFRKYRRTQGQAGESKRKTPHQKMPD